VTDPLCIFIRVTTLRNGKHKRFTFLAATCVAQ